jgi:hypothetical protein
VGTRMSLKGDVRAMKLSVVAMSIEESLRRACDGETKGKT